MKNEMVEYLWQRLPPIKQMEERALAALDWGGDYTETLLAIVKEELLNVLP